MSRMMAAAIRPMPSEPAATVWALVATGPPTSTCSVSSPAARMGATSAAASSAVSWSAVLSRATSAYAVVASAETWRAPSGVNGLVTLTTCSASATSARIVSTRLDQLRRGHAGVGVDDDLHGVARLLREAVLERVGDALRLRARLEVVLLELPSERAGQREGPDQCGDPGQDHETAVPEAPISETYQHRDSFIGSSVVCLRR